MATFSIRKGLDIRLAGAPDSAVADAPDAATIRVFPADVVGIKPRLLVKEGDVVQRGQGLIYDKRNEAFRLTAPSGGTVKQIVIGPRRLLEQVVIEVDPRAPALSFGRFQAAQLASLAREQVLSILQNSGLLALIRQRPFSRMASATATPKSIFVNAGASAPHAPDANVVLKGRESAFQAGLDVLTRLTAGKVHLCLHGGRPNAAVLTSARNVEVHTFTGPHPAGNPSIHISRVDPIKPGDVVWTVTAGDAALIGELFLTGEVPSHRIVGLSGTGVAEAGRRYFRARAGAPLATLLDGRLAAGEQRVIRGDILSGVKTTAADHLRLGDAQITVIPEDRERHLLGWMMPGANVFTVSRSFLSGWLGRGRTWTLGTNQHGEPRPMVLTGLYDEYLPLNIMTDFLLRAVLANDTEEAIKLGILETDPEDFAACAVACPSKMDLPGIIRRGLNDIEREGI